MKSFSIQELSYRQKKNRRRILEISFKKKLSHIGSCLNSIDIIDAIYQVKKPKDVFVLSNGHAGISWYVVLENNKLLDSEKTFKLNIHPDRKIENGIYVSTGSLGHGLSIALGMAIADPKNNVYCLISDGECSEGSMWESLRIARDLKINNLKIIITANGWGAYGEINLSYLQNQFVGFNFRLVNLNGHDEKSLLKAFDKHYKSQVIFFAHTVSEQLTFLKGQDAHYYVMNERDYESALKKLS